MVAPAIRRRRGLEAAAAVLVGTLVALSGHSTQPWLVIVFVVALAASAVLIARPGIAILLMILGYATIFSPNAIPYFGAGGISLNVLDFLLVALLGRMCLRWLVERRLQIDLTPVGIGLAAFLVIAVLSTAMGLYVGTTTLNEATTSLRTLGYYVTYFVVVFLLPTPRHIRFLFFGAIALSVVTALAMIAQFIVGPSVPILAGRIEQFAQDGSLVADVARVLPPGRYLVLFGFIASSISIALHGVSVRRAWHLVLWLVLSTALLLTFNRNLWLSSAIAFAVFAVLAGRADRRRLMTLFTTSILVGVLLAAVLTAMFPQSRVADLGRSVGERFSSLASSTTYTATNQADFATSSLEFRKIETIYAFKKLWPPSLLGLGLGAPYRPKLSIDWAGFDGRGYIHDGHLWVLLKTGVLGYLALMTALVAVPFTSLRNWRRVPAELQPAVVGTGLTVIAVILSSIVDPIIVDAGWTALFGLIAGAVQVLVADTRSRGAGNDIDAPASKASAA